MGQGRSLSRTRSELLQRQWHKRASLGSNGLPRRKRERSLLQAQVPLAPPVPRLSQLLPPLRLPLLGVTPVVVHRPQVPQGAVQPLLVVPPHQSGQRLLRL